MQSWLAKLAGKAGWQSWLAKLAGKAGWENGFDYILVKCI
jgi:hypothetical protein